MDEAKDALKQDEKLEKYGKRLLKSLEPTEGDLKPDNKKTRRSPRKLRPRVPCSDFLLYEIFAKMAQGQSMASVLRQNPNRYPSRPTIMAYLFKREREAPQSRILFAYHCARECLADFYFDEILDIADDGRNDFMEKMNKKGEVYIAADYENINRSRLRVLTRQWVIARMNPQKYSEKALEARQAIELEGFEGEQQDREVKGYDPSKI